jgi:hypothetical protein
MMIGRKAKLSVPSCVSPNGPEKSACRPVEFRGKMVFVRSRRPGNGGSNVKLHTPHT